MCPVWTREVKIWGELFTLPFAGENEVYSIFGNRDCNCDGKWDTAKHGGWDVRPTKVGGVVPTKQGQDFCSGRVANGCEVSIA